MSASLETTWTVLRETKNKAAESILMPLLDSPDPRFAQGALQVLLKRRSELAHRELLSRWSTLGDQWKSIIGERPGSMSGVLRDAVLERDGERCVDACEAIVHLREYDLVPVLITAAEDLANPHAQRAAETLVQLAERLVDELVARPEHRPRRDPELVRQHVMECLEKSVRSFGKHRRVQLVEAFLMLAGRDSPSLKKILTNPHAPCYLPLVDLMSKSTRPAVIRLLLSILHDPQAPAAVIEVMMNRRDQPFWRALFVKTGAEPNQAVRNNLGKVESVRWASEEPTLLLGLDDTEQRAALALLMATQVSRVNKLAVIRYLLIHGTPGGRRAAAMFLAQFKGAECHELVLAGLEDPDPYVQANVVVQLRDRGIPGSLNRLVSLVDSPHQIVRDAARRCLGEFNFKRYLSAFDMLTDEVRQSTGRLVQKVDDQTVPLLAEELSAPSRTRRLRALAVVAAIELAKPLAKPILKLLAEEDYFVRAQAASTLAGCDTDDVRSALGELLEDRSVAVRQAARRSLQAIDAGPSQPSERRRPDTLVAADTGPPSQPAVPLSPPQHGTTSRHQA